MLTLSPIVTCPHAGRLASSATPNAIATFPLTATSHHESWHSACHHRPGAYNLRLLFPVTYMHSRCAFQRPLPKCGNCPNLRRDMPLPSGGPRFAAFAKRGIYRLPHSADFWLPHPSRFSKGDMNFEWVTHSSRFCLGGVFPELSSPAP